MTQDPNASSSDTPSPPMGFTLGGTPSYQDDEPLPPQATPHAAPARAESTSDMGLSPAQVHHILELDRLDALKGIARIPLWARVPEGLKFPRGRQVAFVRFPSAWTDKPNYGHTMPDLPGLFRECILWNPSPGDEQIAAERCVSMATEHRYMAELIKQMIRSIDGLPTDQTGMPTAQNVDLFWAQIGVRGRDLLVRYFSQMTGVTKAQRMFFFGQCVGLYVAS